MKFLPYLLKHLRRNWFRTALHRRWPWPCASSSSARSRPCLAEINGLLAGTSATAPGHAPRGEPRLQPAPLLRRPDPGRPRRQAGGDRELVRRARSPAKKEEKKTGEELHSTTDFSNFFPNLAVDPEPFFAMYPEYILPPEQFRDFMGDLRGAIIGRKLANRFGWKVGDTFYLESFIPPYRKRGRPVRVRGEGDLRHRPRQVPRHRHEHHALQLQVPLRGDRAADRRRAPTTWRSTTPRRRARSARAIDALFENSDAQTHTETEKAFARELRGHGRQPHPAPQRHRPRGDLHHPPRGGEHDEHRGARAEEGDRRPQDAGLHELSR